MDSPVTPGRTSASGRSSVIDSLRGCTLSGVRIPKEELKMKITCPEYIRLAMREAIRTKDVEDTGVLKFYDAARAEGAEAADPPEFPLVVFINSKSGGRHGPELKARLQELMGEEQVFELSSVKPHEFVRYGLYCLEKFADLGDNCAKEIRQRLRVVVAGGDGTVGWVLGCLGELNKQERLPVPPTGIIPLGTGNDLSRSFGWGGSFPFNWKAAIKRTLDKITTGPVVHLDSWHMLISTPAGEELEIPHSLKPTEETPLDQELEVEGELPEKVSCYQGVFYNYFSIGMDAQVAYGFHNLRNEKPYLAQGPISNKVQVLFTLQKNHRTMHKFKISDWKILDLFLMLRKYVLLLTFPKVLVTVFQISDSLDTEIYNFCCKSLNREKLNVFSRLGFSLSLSVTNLIYSGYSCKQGWFFTPCSSDPGLRSLKNILRIYAKKVNSSIWEQVPVPSSVRSVVALNLPSYGSGRNPWGNLKPEYLEKRGFVEARADDGFLEVFGFKQGWHASMVMVELISAKHIIQASAIRFELRGGEWTEAYMQMDGEPWKQPMNKEFSSFIEIKRVPHHSLMVKGE
ncbi:diacylglycerol kinase family protein [Striga asiatica]|uniref:Diacylglycerol kinase n=1 Tax=Striga asiatica TaxID=4170 RepID=A0A5A7PZQ9_STRAF|nr:diacylglycerol kinase family protein [Striga asiatica]